MKKKPIKITRERMSPLEGYSQYEWISDILYKSKIIIINNSTLKAMYSFPLSQRFKKLKQIILLFITICPALLLKEKHQ
jgi:hypothetical protein